MIERKRVTEVPFELIKVRDLFKRRNPETEIVLDGDRQVLRLTIVSAETKEG